MEFKAWTDSALVSRRLTKRALNFIGFRANVGRSANTEKGVEVRLVTVGALVGGLLSTGVGVAVGLSATPYGGLGATLRAFYAQNPHGPGAPPLGVAYYKVDSTRRGRVTAYQVEETVQPADSPRERIALLAGINLPADAVETSLNSDTCVVWKSATLKRLIGLAYAAATTARGVEIAWMRAEKVPRC